MNTNYGITELGEKVAAALGFGWKSKGCENDSYNSRADLEAPDGMRFFLATESWGAHNGRLKINGLGPKRKNGQTVSSSYRDGGKNSITVAGDSTPERIAKEITHRLMKTWKPQYDILVERGKQEDDYEEKQDQNYKAVCELLGINPNEQGHRNREHTFGESIGGEYICGNVSGSTIRFEHLDLKPEIGLKVLQAIINILAPVEQSAAA